MPKDPQPPVAAVLAFIDAVNRADVNRLAELMLPDHELRVLNEPPVVGIEANTTGWRGYVSSFPQYVIYPHRISKHQGTVAVLGHTTGSHLGLPDDKEIPLTVIWVANVTHGKLSLWRILEDTPANRQTFGLAE